MLRQSVFGISIASFVAVGFISVGTQVALAQNPLPNWTGFNAASVPATVESLTTPSGNEMGQGINICWGNWCVGFPIIPLPGELTLEYHHNVYLEIFRTHHTK